MLQGVAAGHGGQYRAILAALTSGVSSLAASERTIQPALNPGSPGVGLKLDTRILTQMKQEYHTCIGRQRWQREPLVASLRQRAPRTLLRGARLCREEGK